MLRSVHAMDAGDSYSMKKVTLGPAPWGFPGRWPMLKKCKWSDLNHVCLESCLIFYQSSGLRYCTVKMFSKFMLLKHVEVLHFLNTLQYSMSVLFVSYLKSTSLHTTTALLDFRCGAWFLLCTVLNKCNICSPLHTRFSYLLSTLQHRLCKS